MARRKDLGKAPFVICHWDTFDNETIKIGEANTLDEAISFIEKKYGDRLDVNGADKVEVIDLAGDIVHRQNVG